MKTVLSPYFHTLKPYNHLNFARGGWKKGQPRPFVESLDGGEMNDIKFILEKLSRESWLHLLKLKKELKKRGEKLDHVHPLSFFIGVLSPTCAEFFQNLKKKGGLPYSEFVSGAVESFHDERKHGNITDQQLSIFAQKTGRDLGTICSYAYSNNWNGFINYL